MCDDQQINLYPIEYYGNSIMVTIENLPLLKDFDNMIPFIEEIDGEKHMCIKVSINSNNDVIYLDNNLIRYIPSIWNLNCSMNEKIERFIDNKKKFIHDIVSNVYAHGFDNPSQVQDFAIPQLINANDSIVMYKSGTGKTFSFILGSFWHLDQNDDSLQIVILTKTHEIARQIHKIAQEILPGANIALCIGRGKNVQNPYQKTAEENEMLSKANIIVGTFGKFWDKLSNPRKIINISNLKSFIVDEFDALFDSGNSNNDMREKLCEILDVLKNDTNCRLCFFSATSTLNSLNDVHNYCHDPFVCILDEEKLTLEGIKQYYIDIDTNNISEIGVKISDSIFDTKIMILCDLFSRLIISQCIIFAPTHTMCVRIKAALASAPNNFSSEVFSGQLEGSLREEIQTKFIQGNIRRLVATEVLARGFDVSGINLVIIFTPPRKQDGGVNTYIHQCGRTGRFGKKGTSIIFICSSHDPNHDERGFIDCINSVSQTNPITHLPEGDLAKLL